VEVAVKEPWGDSLPERRSESRLFERVRVRGEASDGTTGLRSLLKNA